MNEIISKFLIAGDNFMPKTHLRQPGFIYSVCGPFTKNKGRIKKKQEIQDIFIKTNWIKPAFNVMSYGDFKDLTRKAASDNSSNIAKNPKYNGYQCGLVSMLYKFFDKKSSGGAVTRADKSAIKSEIMSNHHPLD